MLGWFKKKFKKQETPETAPDAADLKIPVAPRDFGPPKPEEDVPAPVEAIQEPPVDEVTPEEVVPPSIDEDVAPLPPSDSTEQAEEEPHEEQQEVAADEPADHIPEQLPEVSEDSIPADIDTEVEPEELEAPEEIPVSEEQLEEDAPAVTIEIDQSEKPEEAEQLEPDTSSLAEIEKLPVSSEKIPVAKVRTSAEQEPAKEQPKKKDGFFARLSEKLSRTRESFTYQLDTLFLGKKEIDADLLDNLEELLITADLGVSTTEEILDYARKQVKRAELSDPAALKKMLKKKIKKFITDYQEDAELVMPAKGPFVIMVVGVNGVGKTTTIGKITHKFLQSDQSVLLVAADTFRAAAVSQLKIWGERNNVPVISQHEGADPSSVVFDALAHAKSKAYDVVLVDTAGRLHTQANLMEELKKIKRVMNKQLPGAPHEVMLVIDATTGQNGISQAKLFDAAVDLTGITLTKLDGTAKGGIVANICRELKTPIRFIGVGEQLEDLRDFDADEFVEALFESKDSKRA